MSRERANSVVRIGSLVWPLLAGFLIALVGASNVLFVDADTFTASATIVALGVPKRAGREATVAAADERGYASDLALGVPAWAYLELGDEGRAEEVVQEGIERARAQGNRLALVELLRVRSMVLVRRRRADEAEGVFQEAVSVARLLRYPYAEARSLYEWGLMQTGRPETKQGWDRLEEAAEIFRRLESRPYLELAQKAMAGLGPG
ncbi:MAG: hypothetical protein AVDCRST_MAG58-3500 [uncultured Rubrobacteraceae bacterium]|uniref:Uncharacterized protein n=1 Tax=uncultured Rubrobacteraceae bacterium TaxID=349277 RepID=A0A6J4R8U3_9ACTN|nr:MAG: hypothetical protein AVDCRST_MAG58-3500 [uncultured Rubrobacteraceae bacterium]